MGTARVETPSIHVLMARVMADLPAIGKDQRNVKQGFNFRGIDDVLNALHPLLVRHGVFFAPEVLERVADQRPTASGGVMYVVNLHVRYTFYGPAGDSLIADGWGEGTDSGDKATNKAMTGAMKYVLFQVFAIATEETRAADSDRTTPEATVAAAPAGVDPATGEISTPAPAPVKKATRRRTAPTPSTSTSTTEGLMARVNALAERQACKAALSALGPLGEHLAEAEALVAGFEAGDPFAGMVGASPDLVGATNGNGNGHVA